jgi:hypothetical protein
MGCNHLVTCWLLPGNRTNTIEKEHLYKRRRQLWNTVWNYNTAMGIQLNSHQEANKQGQSADAGLMFITCNLRRIRIFWIWICWRSIEDTFVIVFWAFLVHRNIFKDFCQLNIPALVFVKADYPSGKLRKINLMRLPQR